MLFDSEEFLDLLPRKPLRQRLAESTRFRLGAELLLVLAVGWLLWFGLVNVHLPGDVATAFHDLDEGTNTRDPRKVMAVFPSDVTIVSDGQALGLSMFSDRTTAFLQAKEIASIAQSTQLAWARQTDESTLQVRAIQLQTIERPGHPTQSRRVGLTTLWKLTAAGWRLKNYNSKSLRPRS